MAARSALSYCDASHSLPLAKRMVRTGLAELSGEARVDFTPTMKKRSPIFSHGSQNKAFGEEPPDRSMRAQSAGLAMPSANRTRPHTKGPSAGFDFDPATAFVELSSGDSFDKR